YHQFHKKQFFNFQLNRWYSIGLAHYEDMLAVGKKIKKYEDWKPEMIRVATQAEREKRLMNAAIYYRSAEFFTHYQDPDSRRIPGKRRPPRIAPGAGAVFRAGGVCWLKAVMQRGG
ncbi:MAG: hypothetical protein GY792_33650, partial [Gammaproteobacteria bacterium]|nr:hypothetical protein [Gammaproteobacteria bacterium]